MFRVDRNERRFRKKIVTEKYLNRYKIQIELISIYHASINKMIGKKTLIVDKCFVKTDRK